VVILPLFSGLSAGLSLIVAIGAQNAFVLRQGIQRSHVVMVVAVCAVSDLVLILLGVAGIGILLDRAPAALVVIRWAGAAFLLAYGALAARRALPALRRGAFRVVGATGGAVAFVRDGDAGGDAVLVAVNAGDEPVEVPAFVPQLGEATLRDVPLPDAGGGSTVVVAPDGRLAVPVPPRTGRIMVRA